MSVSKTLGLAALLLSGATIASGATFSIYTDRTAFEAALSSYTVETFAGNTTSSGVVIAGGSVAYVSNELSDQINDGVGVTSTTFSFPLAINAFGGDWNLAVPGGPGTGIALSTFDGVATRQVGTEIPNTIAGTFWGFISDTPFTQVLLTEGIQASGVETYTMDNLTTGFAATVPLPASLPVLLGGFGLLGALRRKRARG